MTLKFAKASFITSSLTTEEFPRMLNTHGVPIDEVALVGRSNVGKSSLINHLLRKPSLAKVSAKPGKTQTLNFFNVDEKIALVDLPGYGFAKVPKELKKKWAGCIDHYLRTRESLKLLVLLFDSRHKPSDEDIELLLWAKTYEKPFLIVLTKFDKLKAKERKTQKEKILTHLKEATGIKNLGALVYSIKNTQMRQVLINEINKALNFTPKEDNETPS